MTWKAKLSLITAKNHASWTFRTQEFYRLALWMLKLKEEKSDHPYWHPMWGYEWRGEWFWWLAKHCKLMLWNFGDDVDDDDHHHHQPTHLLRTGPPPWQGTQWQISGLRSDHIWQHLWSGESRTNEANIEIMCPTITELVGKRRGWQQKGDFPDQLTSGLGSLHYKVGGHNHL